MKKLIEYIGEKNKIKNLALLEKDIILHKLLSELSNNAYFFKNYVFKGGTCLTKCYYGYYRFSEDLDFSWGFPNIFEELSQTKIRKLLSKEISKLAKLLEETSKNLELNFKAEKSNSHYIMMGGSNKFVTFKLHYKSELDKSSFIKVQVNYIEKFKYKSQLKNANSIIDDDKNKNLEFLFPKDAKYLLSKPKINSYDIKEILLEKIRAILTRRGVKSRDYIDVYLIQKNEKLKIKNFEEEIIDKIQFVLRYEKYQKNLKDFKIKKFVLGDEAKLLLKPLDDGFKKFLPSFFEYLKELEKKLETKK